MWGRVGVDSREGKGWERKVQKATTELRLNNSKFGGE